MVTENKYPVIIHIINFIRGVEPRAPELDILEPVAQQIRLLKKYNLPGTFLIQYDAMCMNAFSDLLKEVEGNNIEIGAWFEIVKPLVEKAGLAWRGRSGFPWDWHANVGFSIGYTPTEREKLADVYMEDFKSIFGDYPESVGSWVIDAHTLAYIHEKYGIKAACICKDQYGTDGYTLWGGYYNQAYFPSRMNVFAPAQTMECRIPVPVFRMLGSDPIYQYDAGLGEKEDVGGDVHQPVITLEPVCSGAGGCPEWVDWYFKENFTGKCIPFGYAQIGQENSFGWDAMKKGLSYQMKVIAQKAGKGELRVEKLAESAVWFAEKYQLTPDSLVTALNDWKKEGRKSVWYNNRFYRVNFFWEGDNFRIRDIYIFDETYKERYLKKTCTTENCIFDNLPVIDGFVWSSGSIRAGIYPCQVEPDNSDMPIRGGHPLLEYDGRSGLQIEWPLAEGGFLQIHCKEKSILIRYCKSETVNNLKMKMQWAEDVVNPVIRTSPERISYLYNNVRYSLRAITGEFHGRDTANEINMILCGDELEICFDREC